MTSTVLDRFTYIRECDLGDIITIQKMGEGRKQVELIRRGRQKIRVQGEHDEESELVKVVDVIVP